MAELVVRSHRAMLPDGEQPAAVVVANGRIAAVLPYGADVAADASVDLGDVTLLPGLVDTHVHVNEPGRTDWEGFATATRAAAAGGVTTIVDMPLNSLPPTVDAGALAAKRAAARGQAYVDVAFWGGAVPSNAGRRRELHDAGVLGFKCFTTDSGVPEFPPLSAAGLDAALAELAAFDGLLLVHAEDPGELDRAPAAGDDYASFVASRPVSAETVAIARVLASARRTGARVHILHLSAADALSEVERARADGVRVSVETCPHYLSFATEDVPDGATEFKCCPPIRGAADRERLWRALATGAIDAVVSDHSPCPPELKSGGFGAAWGGVASLQLGLPAVWTQARRRGHPLSDVVRWMATAPARIAGLAGKGAIEPGGDADLVAFAPDRTWTVDPAALLHRHPVTPYAGRELTGVVAATWLRGERVDAGADAAPRGRRLWRPEPVRGTLTAPSPGEGAPHGSRRST